MRSTNLLQRKRECCECGGRFFHFQLFFPLSSSDLFKDCFCLHCLPYLNQTYLPIKVVKASIRNFINKTNKLTKLFGSSYSLIIGGRIGAVYYPLELFGQFLYLNGLDLKTFTNFINSACEMVDTEYLIFFKMTDPNGHKFHFIEYQFSPNLIVCDYYETLK